MGEKPKKVRFVEFRLSHYFEVSARKGAKYALSNRWQWLFYAMICIWTVLLFGLRVSIFGAQSILSNRLSIIGFVLLLVPSFKVIGYFIYLCAINK